MKLYKATGKLRYTRGYWLLLDSDQGIADFYRALMPKSMDVIRPRYEAHITVIRPDTETPQNLDFWRAHEGEIIEFYYEPIIRTGESGVYYWLNCFSKRLEEIRLELGLPVAAVYTIPPDGFRKCFHMTVANRTHLIN